MIFTKKEAEEKFPGVIFTGNEFWIGEDVKIENEVTIEGWARIESGVRIAREALVGGWTVIARGTVIGAWAVIESRAVIGDKAVIKGGARILTVNNKYVCNISPCKNEVKIRIGCELHSISEWEEMKEDLADKNDRGWWDNHGQYIYEFLKGEAERYTERYLK